jgi:hypothetical protein
MNWEKLKSKNYFKEPVEHIHADGIFDTKEYDKLYENQNNLNHKVWQEFDKQYKIGFEFKENITEIDLEKPVIALWFFRERADRNHPPQIAIKEKLIPYFPNTFLLTESKNIEIKESKRKYIRNPFVQLDISTKQYLKIVERFR